MQQNGIQNFILLLWLGLGVLGFDYTYAQEISKPKPVRVATPQRGTIEEKITYTGNLEADATIEIYANISGKLVALKVNEGDRVNKGSLLAEIDSRELRIALKQAQAGLKIAESQLSTIKATAQINVETQVKAAYASLDSARVQVEQAQALARAQVTSQFEQAAASVTAAEANLKKVLAGSRNQEVQQAKAAVSGAKAELKNAQVNFDRMQKLHEKEAISDQDLDNARAQLDGAKAQYESLVEQLSLIEEGTRQEDIIAAEAQLSQVQASLGLARAMVDTQDWKTQIALAHSQLRQAEASLLSSQKLLDIHAWEYDIAAAQAQFDQASEQVALARKRLSDATITSPIDGIVVNRDADIGDYAAAAGTPGGNPILTIVKMDVVKAVFTVSETDLSNVAVPTAVSIATGQQHLKGKIDFISPIVAPENRTVTVKAEIPNSEYRLKPGMFVEVNIDLSGPDETLLLPREAVLDIQGKVGHIFIAIDGKAQQQPVKIGLTWGESISIIEGLTDSTPVIISGHRQLTDGTEILIVK